jgi:hypothetical protein
MFKPAILGHQFLDPQLLELLAQALGQLDLPSKAVPDLLLVD